MQKVVINDGELRRAAAAGTDEFADAVGGAILRAVGGELTSAAMGRLTADQVTLLAWRMMRAELAQGGWVQLIHNGLGPFVFKNPLAKALKMWGLGELSKQIYDAHSLYTQHGQAIEAECSDDEFMALYERFSDFDRLDDCFVENEEQWAADIAHYVDDHLDRFVEVTSKEQGEKQT